MIRSNSKVMLTPFAEEELGSMLSQILAIPSAKELSTPNARKTCALAIWLIQTQRLPVEVLEPFKEPIAYALRRGIGGELGKEGKKGSQTDGLKVRTRLGTVCICADCSSGYSRPRVVPADSLRPGVRASSRLRTGQPDGPHPCYTQPSVSCSRWSRTCCGLSASQ